MDRPLSNASAGKAGLDPDDTASVLGPTKRMLHQLLPAHVKVWFRRLGRRLRTAVASMRCGLSGAHPVSADDPDYALWDAQQVVDKDTLRTRLPALAHMPEITVVLPVHDPEIAHLRRALDTVAAQLYSNWELSIVDDGSTNPAVPALLERYAADRPNVRYTRLSSSQHIAGATNVAIAQARGEFVAFLDHDDELTPDALLEVADVIAADSTVDIIYSDH